MPCLEMTAEEKAFWERQPDGEAELEKYQVGRYAATEDQLPALMESYGFVGVSAGYAVIDLTPDDPKYPRAMAEAMIEAERAGDLESADEWIGLLEREGVSWCMWSFSAVAEACSALRSGTLKYCGFEEADYSPTGIWLRETLTKYDSR